MNKQELLAILQKRLDELNNMPDEEFIKRNNRLINENTTYNYYSCELRYLQRSRSELDFLILWLGTK